MSIKELRESIEVEDINFLLGELGCSPLVQKGDVYITETICHNAPGEGSHKLYFYPSTHLWQCYTQCQSSFDIFELIVKHKSIMGTDWSIGQAIGWAKNKLGYDDFNFFDTQEKITDDWKILNRYLKEATVEEKTFKTNEVIEAPFLEALPKCVVTEWMNNGINQSTHLKYGIRYYPVENCIIIPHLNTDGALVGIRQRTLEPKQIELFGKYRPARIQGNMYNHHLGYELYGLNYNKDNIKKVKKAIIFESEKSVMIYDTLFGADSNISVACCGSNISQKQVDLLISLGVREIIVAFDKEYQQVGDTSFKRQIKMFENIHRRFNSMVEISFMFDKENKLKYKSSPVDEGAEKFLHLFKNRIFIKEKGE